MGQEIIKNVPWIDFVFSGSALRSFPTAIGHLIDNEPEKCHSIDGVFTKRNTVGSKPRPSVHAAPASEVVSATAAPEQLININKPATATATITKSSGDTNGAGNGNGANGNGHGNGNGNGASKIGSLGSE